MNPPKSLERLLLWAIYESESRKGTRERRGRLTLVPLKWWIGALLSML